MIRSLFTWFGAALIIPTWYLLMLVVRLFDRDPVRYRTGYFLRKIGNAFILINPAWKLKISGTRPENPRNPYVVVCNHQSLADIPLISNLPWEMKWIGKESLFKTPLIGWMIRMAGDIPVDRKSARSGVTALKKAGEYLAKKCSVMIFPEGTRTRDGKVHAFNDGAFYLAIRNKVPVLPLAIEGSFNCIPKNTWKFGEPSSIQLKILPPISTEGMGSGDVGSLNGKVRAAILEQIAEWRGVSVEYVDGLK